MNEDIQVDELLLELLKIERLEEKNRPRSKDDIVAAMARWAVEAYMPHLTMQ